MSLEVKEVKGVKEVKRRFFCYLSIVFNFLSDEGANFFNSFNFYRLSKL